MVKMLAEEGVSLATDSGFETARQTKEELCYVSSNIKSEQGADGEQYTLPDGNVISVGAARYQVPEAFFKPDLLNPDLGQGIHNLVFDSIMKSDIDTRPDLYQNVVLAGGNTLFDGLAKRLDDELNNLAPPSTKVNVVAPPERKYSAWIGGSIMAALSTSQQTMISAAEYKETGPNIVQMKCP